MFNQFRNKFPLTDEKWIEYTNYFNRIEVPAKTILLEEGEISKKLFIIEKGCIRVWFNNNGKDLTTQFFFENQSVASIESFMKKSPSPVVVETIEASVLWWIHKNDLDKILEEIKEIPELRERLINMLFQRTFDYMKYFVSFIKDSPTQRYLNLVEERPQIIQRVPQHYIASYLGVSTVHLSRIKSKLLQKK
ncbi:Crp/Fnr family transcriptional regulator [Flavobacterium sp. ANB]|uniref:Crp/Fnr family transcriptional regulator n=1 Tax=unclassified Flavobacterium TaxID=196869 RepID=UPI0012B943BC|nr:MULTISPECIES: Crp/Fnr family transcriptional regulator [unclassified Flavobacterium]MBF4515913.1 Crp/Fnr family transcriptional regulator [Flavobacterium sp. ANB]MTD68915.1 cyclic nucleotide-binding domain-containing protein [Flavobacterium sp. LC2016-13]